MEGRSCEPLERDGNLLEGRSALDRGGVSREMWRPSLERDGTSLEGGVRPSREADLYRSGAVPLERSEVPPEGGWADCLTGLGFLGLFCACV
jgi:hypothetical protein